MKKQNKIRMSLTFDDGPNTVTTPKVLDVLEQFKVKASFFLVGQNITEETKSLIKRELADGCTIECHSWTHSAMPNFNKEQIQDEIKRTCDLIEKCTDGRRPKFFRPPYIAVNDLMYESIDLPFICGHGVEDWEPKVTAEERAKRVLEDVRDGEIILLHDLYGNDNTVEALKTIIPAMLEQGVELCTVRDLFEKCGVNANQKGKLWTNLFE